LTDPANPEVAGCWNAGGYVHDAQCVTYIGPDVEHQGKDICVNSIANYQFRNVAGQSVFENTVAIVDVTDPATPVMLGSAQYGTGIGYSHQGWLTPDAKKFTGESKNSTTCAIDRSKLDMIIGPGASGDAGLRSLCSDRSIGERVRASIAHAQSR